MTPSRRLFLAGLGASIITAPAIVRAASIMPVKAMPSGSVTVAFTYERWKAVMYRFYGVDGFKVGLAALDEAGQIIDKLRPIET